MRLSNVKFVIATVIIFIILSAQKCTLEEQIKLDSDFVKTETRLDGKFLLKNRSDYFLYTVGLSNELNSQLAIDTATAKARGNLSKNVKVLSKQNIEKYLISNNCNPENEHFNILVDAIVDEIYNITLYQSEVERVYEDRASDPHTFFVVVKIDLNKIKNGLQPIINDNVEHYIKLNPNKSMFDFRASIQSWTSSDFKITNEIIK